MGVCSLLQPGIFIFLVGKLDFVILFSEMQIMPNFRFKLDSKSISSLMWGLSKQMLRCNTAKSYFVAINLLKSFKLY